MTLRSDRWVRGDDEVALDSRVALKMGGAAAIARSASVLTTAPTAGSPDVGICESQYFSIMVSVRLAKLPRPFARSALRSEERRVGKECRSRWSRKS